MRTDWVAKRSGDTIRTQIHYARKGIVTPEMEFIAIRENQSREVARELAAHGSLAVANRVRLDGHERSQRRTVRAQVD